MTQYNHFTNEELLCQLVIRDDLTDLEQELLDRLILTIDTLQELEDYAEELKKGAYGDNT